MAILAAAVAVLGGLSLVHLLFTVGVVRRLREQTEELAQLRADPPPRARIPAPGTRIPDLGAALDATRTVVGFFSPGCGPCADLLPAFVEHAAGSGAPVLAVVVGDGPEGEDMAAALEPVARVIREDHDGAFGSAFGVSSFPSLFAVDGERTI